MRHAFGIVYDKCVEWVWLSVDPLAHLYPSHTPYNYVMNNPVNMTDPDGRSAVCESCPDDGRFDVFTSSSENFEFSNEDGWDVVTNTQTGEQTVVGSEVTVGASNSENNGIDPSVSGGLSVVGGMAEGMKQSYQNDAKNSKVNAAEKVNGKVRNADVVSRGNRAHSNKMAGNAKI
jgi:hypothetical protein